MLVTLDVHPLTTMVIVGTLMVTPLYAFATYVHSHASAARGMRLAIGTLLLGAVMFWICSADIPRRLGLPGNLIVPAIWILPGLALYLGRGWFVARPLSQRWLIGLQLFRVIGALFLLEMTRGNLPGIFAYPAGIGDVVVAAVALGVLVRYRRAPSIPAGAIRLVIVVGVADFLSAFFFGFTSSATPLQLFHPAIPNDVVLFPTGMIPLFLVPHAIFFHVLSALDLSMHPRTQR